MLNGKINIEEIINESPDSLSRFLAKKTLKIMNASEFVSFYNSLDSSLSQPVDLISEAYKRLDIKVNTIVEDNTLDSPVIFICPVISGIIDVISAIYLIFSRLQKTDTKIIINNNENFDEEIRKFIITPNTTFCGENIPLNIYNHLKANRGSILYFIQYPSSYLYKRISSNEMFAPFRMAKYLNIPIVPIKIRSNIDTSNFWLSSKLLPNWIHHLMIFRKFFGYKNSTIEISSGKQANYKNISRMRSQVLLKKLYPEIYTTSGSVKSIFSWLCSTWNTKSRKR